jgi:mannose-1-phosphate guanylyltransferase
MILCAGLGTRLRPLTFELPKPLVPVGDRSILGHIVAELGRAGLAEVVLNTHHLPDAFASIHEQLGIEAEVIFEPEILGTAGGVANARGRLGPAPILLWNGDILARPPIAALFAAAESGGLALGVIPRERGQGPVGLGADGGVVRLRDQTFGDEVVGADYVGIAALGEQCLATLPSAGCLVGDWAIPELRRGGRIAAVSVEGGFDDAGDPRAYLALNLRWLDQRGDSAWVGEGATLEPGVRLVRSIVGPGAHVSGSGIVEGSVIWPGARATAPLRGAIVTTSGRVVLPHSM